MIKIDDILQHELYLNRLATGGFNSVILPSLNELYSQVDLLLRRLDVIGTRAQLESITEQIRAVIASNDGWTKLTSENLLALAEYEATWQAEYAGQALSTTLTAPNRQQISNFMAIAIMSLQSGSRLNSGTWAEFVEQNNDSRTRLINGTIVRGFARGETTAEMSRQIRRQFDGVIKREAETLARTGYIHYAASANEAMIEANTDTLKEYYYVITFDNRTSDTCIALDKFNKKGKRFKVGDKKAPKPPLHFNCRTRRLGVPAGYTPEGTRSAVGGQKGAEAREAFQKREERLRTASQVRYRGRRDANVFKAGQIRANTSYETWLSNQPSWFIKDTLGATRSRLFQQGKLPLSSFSDMTGRPLTLDELRQRHPTAFDRAGLGD